MLVVKSRFNFIFGRTKHPDPNHQIHTEINAIYIMITPVHRIRSICIMCQIIRRNKLTDIPVRFNVFVDINRRCKRTNKMWVVVGTSFCILQSNLRRTFYYGSFTCIHINLLLSTIVQYYQMSLNIMFLIEYNVNLFEIKWYT